MTHTLTLQDYCTGPGHERRDIKFAQWLTKEIRENALELLQRVNALLARMEAAGVELIADPSTNSLSHSGWRPPPVNAATKGAAVRSKHMTGEAIDLYDPKGRIDAWCAANTDALADVALWMEAPKATPGWCHLQARPPKSGRRIFFP